MASLCGSGKLVLGGFIIMVGPKFIHKVNRLGCLYESELTYRGVFFFLIDRLQQRDQYIATCAIDSHCVTLDILNTFVFFLVMLAHWT